MNVQKIVRNDKRTPDQLRPVSFSRGIYEFAAGSFLFEMGKTKVLCAVSLQNGVPQFLRGKGTGWLTAEYALLPTSTMTRTQRDSMLVRKDGRAVEIARFIGRCFRSIVDLSTIGERTITIDCDVLQADGGTRTAAITGSFLSLAMAQEKWLQTRVITKPIIKEKITAVSVGVVNDNVLLDLNYEEDSAATADFNFVITQTDKIIEMQGGAESAPLSWEMFEQVRVMARHGAQQLFTFYDEDKKEPLERTPMFSLKNRQQSSRAS
ncbi:MAG TPA: ribonuclease PH [Candidatus Babeliales bacterium]|jgi:ribonuclease PH|nr:ribonuclease PH [Candidatus Babeliales bacterium]